MVQIQSKELVIFIFNFIFIIFCEAAENLQQIFQEPATIEMEGIFLFNCHLLFLIFAIVLLVWWLLYLVYINFLDKFNFFIFNFTHSSNIEIIWTVIPALILISLASPSFALLYSLDEIINPEITLKIFGHQWYWSYEASDYRLCFNNFSSLKFSSYLLTNDFLKNYNHLGFLRLLETNKRIFFPSNTHIRLLVTAVDVLHSWTVPSFGIKIDACPGRLNQANLFIKRFGVFFGQCSEICGVNHGFMPIVAVVCPSSSYYNILYESTL